MICISMVYYFLFKVYYFQYEKYQVIVQKIFIVEQKVNQIDYQLYFNTFIKILKASLISLHSVALYVDYVYIADVQFVFFFIIMYFLDVKDVQNCQNYLIFVYELVILLPLIYYVQLNFLMYYQMHLRYLLSLSFVNNFFIMLYDSSMDIAMDFLIYFIIIYQNDIVHGQIVFYQFYQNDFHPLVFRLRTRVDVY